MLNIYRVPTVDQVCCTYLIPLKPQRFPQNSVAHTRIMRHRKAEE